MVDTKKLAEEMNGSEVNLTWKEWQEIYWAELTTDEYSEMLRLFREHFGEWPSGILTSLPMEETFCRAER